MTADVFTPTDRQDQVWEAIEQAKPNELTIIGYGGAVGGGKTRALAELAIDFALDHPGNRILVGRRDLVDLRTTTLEEFDLVCPPELIVESPNSPVIIRGIRDPAWPEGVVSRVYFKELKDYRSFGSEQYGHVLLEEAGEIPEPSFKMAVTRCRHSAASKRAIVAASNPYPGWFERWFIDQDYDEELLLAAGATVKFIPAKIADNPYLPANYEEILRAVFKGDDDWLSRMVEGRFDQFEGQIYRELGPAHEWQGPLPAMRKLCGGLDFGGANERNHKTAGVVSGITGKNAGPGVGENWDMRFAHFEDSGPSVHANLWAWMRGVEQRMGRRVHWRADKTQMWGISLAQNAGFLIEPSHGGRDSVQQGIALVKRRFADGTSWFTPELRQLPMLDGRPLNGEPWYDRMRRYRWDEQPDETKAAKGVPLKRDDDTADADRYRQEEVDGFPVYRGPAIAKTTLSGKPRRRKAV